MSKHPKISRTEFQVMLDSGSPYTGLVEEVGYVYWTEEDIHFIRVYPVKNRLGQVSYSPKPVENKLLLEGYYIEKPFFLAIAPHERFKYREFEQTIKKRYILQVKDIASLEYTDRNLYKEYHDGVEPTRNDKVQPSSSWKDKADKIFKNRLPDEVAAVANAGREIDDKVGVYVEGINRFGPKKIPYVGNILAGMTIVSNINDGDYYAAIGEIIIIAAGWYGFAWEVGIAIYESERFIDYWARESNINLQYWHNKNPRPGTHEERMVRHWGKVRDEAVKRYENKEKGKRK